MLKKWKQLVGKQQENGKCFPKPTLKMHKLKTQDKIWIWWTKLSLRSRMKMLETIYACLCPAAKISFVYAESCVLAEYCTQSVCDAVQCG